ncbi:GNAT family N-acetyltransferase [Clostridium sp. MCC353]|uniref:GNAT family N-acetyltransferase n=1 Tax=Clostridium sp. MCC353 TaxID=2592646 RepID=UPI001C02B11D|nr:GNAT family N-acetyltransferase [Clostridium sp. MCC353]MBT9778495.1 GNAT family N-acetyltransferase [Clostridium sp. MCC353]
MIGYLNENEKNKSELLWKQAFPEDSESFDQYYFSHKVKGNRILAKEEDGIIVSMAHLNPYLVQAGSHVWRSDYIVGVATDKERRHRGYMREILTWMMGDMYEEKMPFCFLMPADEKIYLPFDFTYIFDQPHWKLKEGCFVNAVSWKEAGKTLEETAAFMEKWLSSRFDVYCRRDEAYVELLLKELASENGRLNLLFDDGRLIGVESRWGIEKQDQRLLYCENGYTEEEKAPTPAIMARIICLERFMEAICLKDDCREKEMTVTLAVEDRFLPQNHGVYLWHLNHETSWVERINTDSKNRETVNTDSKNRETVNTDSKNRETVNTDSASIKAGQAGELLSMSISRLTSWLFGYSEEAGPEWMKKIRTLKGVFLDEVV